MRGSRGIAAEGLRTEHLSAGSRLVFLTAAMAVTAGVSVYFHSQLITGPLVNAALILTASLAGFGEAVFLGLLPGVAALSTGLLPLPLAPALPFIMFANALYVLVFDRLRARSFAAAVLTAALAKWLFLTMISSLLLKGLLAQSAAETASLMLGWPQFATALAGGAIAFGFLKAVRRV